MKIFSVILLLAFLFFSCSEKEKKAGILSENKMREVMWDMVRADQYVTDFLIKDSTLKQNEESIKLYEEIFHLHKITRQQFQKSLEYYSSRPDLFRPLIDSLAARKNTTPPPNAHPAVKDSLIKLHKPFQKR